MSPQHNYNALVLNADFSPLRVYPLLTWDVGRVFRNVTSGKAVVVEEHDAVLRSASRDWRPPSVVALSRYVKSPERVPFSRINIFIRDEGRCQYCGAKLSIDDLTFDHVHPRSRGGATNFENIVSACVPCNKRKANRTEMKPIREPYVPTGRQMAALRPISRSNVPETWLSYLDWAGVLSSDSVSDVDKEQRLKDTGYWEWPLEQN